LGVIGKLQRLAELRHYSSTLRSAAFHSLRTRRALRRELAAQHEWTALIERGIWSDAYASLYAYSWWGAFKDRRSEVRDYLELGSWEGQSVVLAGWLFPNAHLTAVDWFSNPQVVRNFEHNTAPFKERLTPIKGTSHEVLMELSRAGRQFDVIFIDADHQFDAVLLDTLLSWPMVRVGGCLIWDDYLWTHPDLTPLFPKPALDAWCRTRADYFEVLFADWQVGVRRTRPDPKVADMAQTFAVKGA
jgi:hypothetical protein